MRRKANRETWHRLLEWDAGKEASERLSCALLHLLGYKDIEPSHPLGGPDSKKDITCKGENGEFIVGCYFPRDQKSIGKIRGKFENDISGVPENIGFLFVTNQELRLADRDELKGSSDDKDIEIYHLETLSTILNTPLGYGVRLDFLDIEMEKEEQLAYIVAKEKQLLEIKNGINLLLERTDPRIKGDPAFVEPISVNPITTISRNSYHKCGNCGFGFITGSHPYSTSSVAISATLGFDDRIVVCPKCGNADLYYGI